MAERPAHGEPAGTLVAVNVGLPRDVSWNGRTVHTGVVKRPVTGRRTVRRLNVDGDGQGDLGGHGGEQRAVLVYQQESYRYWSRELGRSDLTPGSFGENLTVDGLPDDEVRIGDRYRIGTALFEVTQPRVTCYRVGLRLDEPRIPALLVSRHRPGFYMRVVEEGEIGAGDAVERVATGPADLTVAAVDALLYLPGHRRELIEQAVAVPALSPGWRASFTAMLATPVGDAGNAGLGPVAPPPAWRGFRDLRVTAVEPESSTVTSLRLADPAGDPLPAALPGQFVTVRVPVPGAPAVLRSYSLSGPPREGGYRISVALEPGGVAGGYLHTAVRPGDELAVAAPRGTFVLRPSPAPMLLVSAGVGVTPVLAMLHALADAEPERRVWWLHSAQDGSRHPFAAETDAVLARLPHAHREVRYTRPRRTDHRQDATGRLSADTLAALDLPADAEAFLCGPPSFVADVTGALVRIGVAPQRVHTELFTAAPALTPGVTGTRAGPPHPPAGPLRSGPAVTFARSGLTVGSQPAYPSLLELAEACDVPVRWSCRTGVCQTCRTGVLSGAVRYTFPPVETPEDGDVLLCCATPDGEVVLDM